MKKRTALLGLFVFIASCAPTTASRNLKPVQNPPNLVGTWKGVWQGDPHHGNDQARIVVESQQGGNLSGAVFLNDGRSRSMTGSVGAKEDGSIWAVMEFYTESPVSFDLKIVSAKRLEGTGQSARHVGPVYLSRE